MDHRNRYEWAEAFLPAGSCGLDIFCGNGYGTWKLAETRVVIGIDASKEAIDFATKNFNRSGTIFQHSVYPFDLPVACFDFVVSLESFEHIEDGKDFFKALVTSIKPGGQFIFSVPNEDHLPLEISGNHFHHKHYTLADIKALLSKFDLQIIDWAGQDTYQIADGMVSGLLEDSKCFLQSRTEGQFLIFAVQKS